MTTDFDRLVYKTLSIDGDKALLVVLLDKMEMGSQITIRTSGSQVMENCVRGFGFARFKKHMIEQGMDWDLVAVRPARLADGMPSTLECCSREMDAMANSISTGDLSGMAIFDKKGMLFDKLIPQKRDLSGVSVFNVGSASSPEVGGKITTMRFPADVRNFDQIVRELLKPGTPAAVQIAYLMAGSGPTPENAKVEIVAQRVYPCHAGLTIEVVRNDADKAGIRWDFIALELSVELNAPLSPEQVNERLAAMRHRIVTGGVESQIVCTRQGELLQAIPTYAGTEPSTSAPKTMH